MPAGMRSASRHGFTLQEMLVVLLVFAVLFLLLFPVLSTERSGRQSPCMSNLHHMTQILQVYHDDWGTYPDALYGVSYDRGPVELRLAGPDYINDPGAFLCPEHPRDRRDPARLVNPIDRMTGVPALDSRGRSRSFPQADSYDFQFRPAGAASTAELHYSRQWAPAAGLAGDRRQLAQRTPPEDTVVTWCLYHSAMGRNGQPSEGRSAIVAFLNGRVQKLPAETLADWPASCTSPPAGKRPSGCPWQVKPGP